MTPAWGSERRPWGPHAKVRAKLRVAAHTEGRRRHSDFDGRAERSVAAAYAMGGRIAGSRPTLQGPRLKVEAGFVWLPTASGGVCEGTNAASTALCAVTHAQVPWQGHWQSNGVSQTSMQSGVTCEIAEAVLAAADMVRGAAVGAAQHFRVIPVPAIARSSTSSAPKLRHARPRRIGATADALARTQSSRLRANATTSVTNQRKFET